MVSAKKLEILKRRQRVYELHLQGKTEMEIANELQNTSQITVSRDLRAMNQEAIKFVYQLAKTDIAAQYKECIDGISLAKKRAWSLYDFCNSDYPNTSDNKVKLMLSALKIIVMSEESKSRLLNQGPNIMTVNAMSERLSEIEQSYLSEQQR